MLFRVIAFLKEFFYTETYFNNGSNLLVRELTASIERNVCHRDTKSKSHSRSDCACKILFNIIPKHISLAPNSLSPGRFQPKLWLVSLMPVSSSFIKIMLGEVYKLWSFLSCIFLNCVSLNEGRFAYRCTWIQQVSAAVKLKKL
jgi:hypothetical protein